MEFNVKNIVEGGFNTTKSKAGDWVKYVSIRLLEESEFKFGTEQKKLLDSLKYRWYYFKRISDNNEGSVIVALHKKEINSWLYVVVNQDGTYEEFKTIQEAKSSFSKSE